MTKKGSRNPGFKGSSGKPDIRADERDIGFDVEFGPGVEIRCRKVTIGPGCRIGLENKDSFRFPAGVRIECDELELGTGCTIDRAVFIEGGKLRFGPGCRVGAGSTIRVKDELTLGSLCQFGTENVMEGRRVGIGRELWTGPQVRIGGGSCFEVQSELVVGYWCHLGMRAFVNTARKVTIGNEVGIGTGSAVFTHGAYQSALDGYPVSFAPVEIGDNCWIPGAVVNPGVKIGRGAVIGVGSVVTKDIPAGSLAAGVPCRVVRENAFPRPFSAEERRRLLADFLTQAAPMLQATSQKRMEPPGHEVLVLDEGIVVQRPGGTRTVFLLDEQRVTGPADHLTERLRDLLRRHGIRFKSDVVAGRYEDWRDDG